MMRNLKRVMENVSNFLFHFCDNYGNLLLILSSCSFSSEASNFDQESFTSTGHDFLNASMTEEMMLHKKKENNMFDSHPIPIMPFTPTPLQDGNAGQVSSSATYVK